jgi:Putative MetA-pathway of phenol degradation
MRRLYSVTRLLFVLTVLGVLVPARAMAQASSTLTNKAFVQTLFNVPNVNGEEVGISNLATQQAAALATLIATTLSTAPVASSSAGFSFYTDSTGRHPKSQSFGPTFADRPLTNGRGTTSFHFSYQYYQSNFDGGFGTADGRTKGLPVFDQIVTYVAPNPDQVQYITRRSYLKATSQTLNFELSYGLTDKFDVGVLVPVVWLELTGRTDEAWDTHFTHDPNNPAADGGRPSAIGTWECQYLSTTCAVGTDSTRSQSRSGFGDITLRLKYALAGQTEGVAIAADVRTPTGDDEEFLGAGKASVKIQLLVLKSGHGPASFHANTGYTAGGLSDEFNYVTGADLAMLSKKQLTVSASFLGRALFDGSLPITTCTLCPPPNPNIIVQNRFKWEKATVNLMQLAAGAKLQVSPNWLLAGSVLIPLNRLGFQPGISPVIGLERTWGGK